jgi:hypothetical protein
MSVALCLDMLGRRGRRRGRRRRRRRKEWRKRKKGEGWWFLPSFRRAFAELISRSGSGLTLPSLSLGKHEQGQDQRLLGKSCWQGSAMDTRERVNEPAVESVCDACVSQDKESVFLLPPSHGAEFPRGRPGPRLLYKMRYRVSRVASRTRALAQIRSANFASLPLSPPVTAISPPSETRPPTIVKKPRSRRPNWNSDRERRGGRRRRRVAGGGRRGFRSEAEVAEQ